MKRIILLGIIAVMLGLVAQVEAVPLIWTLQGAVFDDATSASGSFVYDADTNTYSNWLIAVQSGTLSAFTYDTTNSQLNVSNMDATGVLFIKNEFDRYINFNFTAPLTNAGGLIPFDLTPFFVSFDVSSYECPNCFPGFREFTDGWVTAEGVAVPEPSTLTFVGLMLAGLALIARRVQA